MNAFVTDRDRSLVVHSHWWAEPDHARAAIHTIRASLAQGQDRHPLVCPVTHFIGSAQRLLPLPSLVPTLWDPQTNTLDPNCQRNQ